MVRKKTYLKEWRKHSHLTQDQVIDRLTIHDDELLPRTAASLSRIENGKQIYTQRILEALADIYQVDEPGWLLDRNPKMDGRVIDLMSRLSDKQRDHAMEILETVFKNGTEG